jgi:hypothetical protein
MRAMKASTRESDISKAGSSSVRISLSRKKRTRSCVPSSMGEPQTTISGSPISTSHQRVARHFGGPSWVTRSVPMKKSMARHSIHRIEPRQSLGVRTRRVTVLLDDCLGRKGKAWRSAVLVMVCGSKPRVANNSR